MLALVVRFDLLPRSEHAFDRLVADTTAGILTDEPGTLLYLCHKVQGEPTARLFYELYRDRAAFEAHEAHEAQPHVGVASMVVQGRPGFMRVRTPYVSDADVAAIYTSTAGLTRDPSSLLAEAARLATIVPGLDETGPARGGDRSAGPWPGRDDQDAEDAA
jgi:quinol monooxygenase YgiN